MKGKKEWKNRAVVFLTIIALVSAMLFTGLGSAFSEGQDPDPGDPILPEETVEIVSLKGLSEEAAERIAELGIDVAAILERDGNVEVQAVVTQSDIETLESIGIEVDEAAILEQEEFTVEEETGEMQTFSTAAQEERLQILRANHYTNQSATFLYVEAKSNFGQASGTAFTATWEENGEERSATLSRRSDYGEYLYHWFELPVNEIPDTITIESNRGGSATSEVTEWLGAPREPKEHYVTEFIDSYMTPTQINERIDQLAEEFPELLEVIEMPHKTNGYRRHAQATMGGFTNTAVVVTSNAYGHEGGNDITVEFVNPGEANSDLEVTVDGNDVTVQLATNSSGQRSSTAIDVVNALNEHAGDLVTATTYRGNSGTGLAEERSAELTDGLNAPDYVSREPETVKALRIGSVRDGSNPGVLAYSQEHAREWVTPLVTMETAERLLRNYAHDEDTQKLVDNLEIFLIPVVNPDGANYSFYDFNSQRKNMTNYCPPEGNSDFGARNTWGVDLNRNHTVGTMWDGFVGASSNCTSGSYAGPEPNSEPEARNIVWLAEEFDNLAFGMNIHSHGGYFMWSPGAYDTNRTTLPRPTAGEEEYYWQSSEHILNRIQQHRGTVIRPNRTGPIPDVLYSAAGNSADYLWYAQGIYTWNFEVGAELWQNNRWVSTGFQPNYEAEGHDQYLEFANGLVGLIEVAYEYAMDEESPVSEAVPGSGRYAEPVEVSFETSEPATIYYTLDGSKPTLDSPVLELAGTREPAETLTIDQTTTINFFSVDPKGNVENDYNPEEDARGFNSVTLTIGGNLDKEPGSADLTDLVDRFIEEGEITDGAGVRTLKMHLTALGMYEYEGQNDKLVKHLEGFITLTEFHQNNGMISDFASSNLAAYANYLVRNYE